MARAGTTPEEWRRRAALARVALGVGDEAGPGSTALWAVAWGAMPALDGDDLVTASRLGLWRLADGDDAAGPARDCRVVVWGQPEDVPGLLLVPPGREPGQGDLAAAHKPGQDLTTPGLAVRFLARRFAEHGDDQDLDAAAELHDLTVALGDQVWEGTTPAALGWGAAELYLLTGDEAFLATAERAADALCEAQAADGSVGDGSAGDRTGTARVAIVLADVALAVEDRQTAHLDDAADPD